MAVDQFDGWFGMFLYDIMEMESRAGPDVTYPTAREGPQYVYYKYIYRRHSSSCAAYIYFLRCEQTFNCIIYIFNFLIMETIKNKVQNATGRSAESESQFGEGASTKQQFPGLLLNRNI
jgi:hypothetical protein